MMSRKYLKKATGSSSIGGGAPGKAVTDVASIVREVIDKIRNEGDAAVRQYSEKFDSWSPASFRLSDADIEHSLSLVPAQTIEDIKEVQANVRRVALAQKDTLGEFEIETVPGVFIGQRNNPIQTVGAYIPGGRYPLLASAHMTILTAKVAGVKRVVACTPPDRGQIPHATIAAMHLAGADDVFILGGIQAVAAMAIGTEAIPRVNFLVGPGNAFVAEAKRQLYGEIGIDLFAGPTEILIVADDTADPFLVATDLLSQAEHGPDSPAVLVTTSEAVGRKTIEYCDRLLAAGDLSTAPVASASWSSLGEVIVEDSLEAAFKTADGFAAEHVQVLTARPRDALDHMDNYGALFLGPMTCVSYGDKVIGTNHVLPTRGAARYTGGLWVGKFLRTVTYQEIRSAAESGRLGRLCGRAARTELFEGHARSGDLRASMYLQDEHSWIRR